MKRTHWLIFPLLLFFSCTNQTSETDCDILIAGGGTGGVAAALQACAMANDWGVRRIVLTEETAWLGGQYTSQGVTASDDNSLVEQGRYPVAASELFFRFHEAIRNFYRSKALETAEKTARTGGPESPARRMEREWITGTKFSPGNAWGSRMSFLPKDGVRAIDEMIAPYLKSGILAVHYRTVPTGVLKEDNRVTGLKFRNSETGKEMTIRAKITLDATELGDLLPLSGTPYRIGIEASNDTREPSLFDESGKPLYPEPMPDCQQSFTYTFALEWRPENEDNRLPWEQRPKSYEQNRHRFTMVDANRWFLLRRWNDFAAARGWEENRRTGESKPLPWIPSFWTYRRMLDARIIDPNLGTDVFPRFGNGAWKTGYTPESDPRRFIPNWEHSMPAPGDVIEVNWNSNDYVANRIIDVTPEERETALREAKELSLGFLFWLWYEAPRDPDDPRLDPSKEENRSTDPVTGKKTGWANLKFRPDVMGTKDGLSMYPYIRESRRGRALCTVRQQDLLAPRTSRARLFHDTVGIGHYFLDIHRCDMGCERKRDIQFKHVQLSDGSWAGENSSGRFQIPYGALVPETTDGLLLAAKNIGLTRIAASTYRLHPVEFQIGQAAGAAAALCVKWNCQPREMWVAEPSETPADAEKRLRRLQRELLRADVPLFWNEDCGWDSEDFEAVQWACFLKLLDPHGRVFEPEKLLIRAEAVLAVSRRTGESTPDAGSDMPVTGGIFSEIFFPKAKITIPFGAIERPLTRGEAARILYRESLKRYGLPDS
ncbi:MAG: FAD-dependent oxidoreductase [Candidatus Latescibacterota bacterium]